MGDGGDSGGEIKRISLVRLREDLPRATCLERWTGEHADVVRSLTGIREYTIDVSRGPRPAGSWDAVAVLRFEDSAALRRFETAADVQRQLLATRKDFAITADVFLVDEHRLISKKEIA